MKRQKPWPRTSLHKRSRRGFRGYPIATVALYGPDDRVASKVAVGIIPGEDVTEPSVLERWHAEDGDVRRDARIGAEIVAFIREHGATTVVMTDRIIGCPHEEGKDYPSGEVCPQCPFWADRDRWTGERIQ